MNRAVRALVGYKWLEQAGNGLIQLNVKLWFHGNSTAQHTVLEQIAARHENDPEAFPNAIGPDVHQEELNLEFTQQAYYNRGKRTG